MPSKIRTRVSVTELDDEGFPNGKELGAIEDWDAFWRKIPFPLCEQIEALSGQDYRALPKAIDTPGLGRTKARRILTWLVLYQADPTVRYDQIETADDSLSIKGVTFCANCGKDTPLGRRVKPKPKEDKPATDPTEAEDLEPGGNPDVELVCLDCGHVHTEDAEDADGPSGNPTSALEEPSPSAESNGKPSSPTSLASVRGSGTSSRSDKVKAS